jgi:hypothetical protein
VKCCSSNWNPDEPMVYVNAAYQGRCPDNQIRHNDIKFV